MASSSRHALLSHTPDDDPKFNFGNKASLGVFKLDLSNFVGMPSRLSAENSATREEREGLLRRTKEFGFIDDYKGVRVASDGTRFEITAVVWDLKDDLGTFLGQAAWFDIESVRYL